MLLPHRTGWTTQVEFRSVYQDLFESEGDRRRQRVALSRIAVWQSRDQCPSAVESTSNLLRLILLDHEPHSSSSPQQLRLSYAMALIRFVNSLVDPLQTTYFARSISSLAHQLGLPLWFVELRHQATHEDLPALPVLRQGAHQALDWLFVHYWQPTMINSSHASTSTSTSPSPSLVVPLERFVQSLEQYKTLTKLAYKDRSQAGRVKNDLVKVYRDLERWTTENGVPSAAAAAVTRPPPSSAGFAKRNLAEGEATAANTREQVIEAIVRVLVDEPGWLVPLAKKKRPTTRAPFMLPTALIELYTPLLEYLDETLFALPTLTTTERRRRSLRGSQIADDSGDGDAEQEDVEILEIDSDSDSFIDVLINRIVDLVCQQRDTMSEESPVHVDGQDEQKSAAKRDPSIHQTLSAWILHLVFGQQTSSSSSNLDIDTIEEILKTCIVAATPSSIALVEAITNRISSITDDGAVTTTSGLSLSELCEKIDPLVRIVRTNLQQEQAAASTAPSAIPPTSEGRETEAEEIVRDMIRKSLEIERKLATPASPVASSLDRDQTTTSALTETSSTSTTTWSTVSNFVPSPIGTLPTLSLELLGSRAARHQSHGGSGGDFEGLDLVVAAETTSRSIMVE
ncbi:hypothetical protein JCM3766R1_005249 [Sporobolomyces carnicolor]